MTNDLIMFYSMLFGSLALAVALVLCGVWLKRLFHSNHCIDGGTEHSFEPRYSEHPSPMSQAELSKLLNESATGWGGSATVTLYSTHTYVHDVCTRCGKIAQASK